MITCYTTNSNKAQLINEEVQLYKIHVCVKLNYKI